VTALSAAAQEDPSERADNSDNPSKRNFRRSNKIAIVTLFATQSKIRDHANGLRKIPSCKGRNFL